MLCIAIDCILLLLCQLKYHDSGREKDVLPRIGQWNMMNKVRPDKNALRNQDKMILTVNVFTCLRFFLMGKSSGEPY